MKTIKGYFYINTGYVNSTKKEFEIEIEERDDIDDILQDHFNDFLGNVDMGWIITEGYE